ncbi:hypothetical protein RHGRI_025748 [Rhododendron griersonianum]|uniref:CCHC-type domain-containing protein n=1 Tax=Rhododendron griersonianum TaxID=479676 RepID=A0AAV6ITR2_9ERIC|nr:hypothetical protein RHGRI_025748 [Rhododendron griersonianum]
MAEPEILDLEEGSGDTGEISNRCLVGKILAQKTLNLQGVTNILKSSWKTRADFTIALWSSNVFLFRFEDEEDCNEVLKDGPWSVMNNLLVLKPLGKGEVIQSMDFSSCPFWVQIHGLPVDKMSRANAEIIGKRFDKLLAIEGGPEGLLLHRSFLRIKANINLSLPFPKGFWLKKKSPGNSDIWISYKFEKLSDYCYACGRVGHEKKGCRFIPREAGETSCYGPDLRAPKARPCPVPVEEFKKQVDEAEVRVEELLRRRPIFHGDYGARVSNQLSERGGAPPSQPLLESPAGTGGTSPSFAGIQSRTSPSPFLALSHQENPLPKIVAITPIPPILSSPLLNINPTPKPNSFPSPIITIPNPNQSYYVTEPPDSPKSPYLPKPQTLSSPSQSCLNNPTLSTNIINPTSPTEPCLSPMDFTLTSVFDSLSLKRKNTTDFDDHPNPKILKIEGPPSHSTISQPIPKTTTSRTARNTLSRTRKQNPKGRKEIDTGDLNLFDVSVYQSNEMVNQPMEGRNVQGFSQAFVPMEKAPVAGLEQPRSQW